MDELEEYKNRLDNLISTLKIINEMIDVEIEDLYLKIDKYKYTTDERIRGKRETQGEEMNFLYRLKDQLKSI